MPETTNELSGEPFDFLRIYIRDHDGASSGGLRLAKRCYESNKSTALEPRLRKLVDTIADAQQAVRGLAQRLDIQTSCVREAATWVAATIGGLKLNGRVTTYSPLSRVIELEGLSSAVTAQLRLWETLQGITANERRLDPTEISHYIYACHDLIEDLASMHHSAVVEAFTSSTDPLLATAHLTGETQAAKNSADDPPA